MLITPATMLGWGTTYHLPVVLGDRMGADLGLSPEFIFGGLSILMIVTAITAPRVGVLVDRRGPGAFLCVGSLLACAGLVALAYARGAVSYAAVWVLLGFAHAAMLGNASLVALARVAGAQARQAISWMMLLTAINSFFFYPLTAGLAGAFGWRNLCLIYAAAHLLIGLPLLFAVGRLPAAEIVPRPAEAGPDIDRAGVLPQRDRRAALALLMIAFACNGLLSWGLSPNLINLFAAFGVPVAAGTVLASLHGPSQLSGRLIDFRYGARWSPLTMGVFAASLAPPAIFALIFAGHSTIATVIAIGVYGMSSGLISIVRATIPLHLFGRDVYGEMLGRIVLPVNLVCAAAPVIFASLIARAGPAAALVVAFAAAAASLAVLVRLARSNRNASGPDATP